MYTRAGKVEGSSGRDRARRRHVGRRTFQTLRAVLPSGRRETVLAYVALMRSPASQGPSDGRALADTLRSVVRGRSRLSRALGSR